MANNSTPLIYLGVAATLFVAVMAWILVNPMRVIETLAPEENRSEAIRAAQLEAQKAPMRLADEELLTLLEKTLRGEMSAKLELLAQETHFGLPGPLVDRIFDEIADAGRGKHRAADFIPLVAERTNVPLKVELAIAQTLDNGSASEPYLVALHTISLQRNLSDAAISALVNVAQLLRPSSYGPDRNVDLTFGLIEAAAAAGRLDEEALDAMLELAVQRDKERLAAAAVGVLIAANADSRIQTSLDYNGRFPPVLKALRPALKHIATSGQLAIIADETRKPHLRAAALNEMANSMSTWQPEHARALDIALHDGSAAVKAAGFRAVKDVPEQYRRDFDWEQLLWSNVGEQDRDLRVAVRGSWKHAPLTQAQRETLIVRLLRNGDLEQAGTALGFVRHLPRPLSPDVVEALNVVSASRGAELGELVIWAKRENVPQPAQRRPFDWGSTLFYVWAVLMIALVGGWGTYYLARLMYFMAQARARLVAGLASLATWAAATVAVLFFSFVAMLGHSSDAYTQALIVWYGGAVAYMALMLFVRLWVR